MKKCDRCKLRYERKFSNAEAPDCFCSADCERMQEQEIAADRIRAAAPLMLKALKEIVNTTHFCYAENHLIAIAQAAIDAVEGEA